MVIMSASCAGIEYLLAVVFIAVGTSVQQYRHAVVKGCEGPNLLECYGSVVGSQACCHIAVAVNNHSL